MSALRVLTDVVDVEAHEVAETVGLEDLSAEVDLHHFLDVA